MDRKVTPISIGFVPVANDVMIRIYEAKSLSDIKADIDPLFDLRILKEAEFLRFIFLVIMIGTFHCLREEGHYKFIETKTDNKFSISSRILLEANSTFILDVLLATLKQGYDSNTQKKIVRERIIGLVISFMNLWIMDYYFVKNSMLDELSNPDPLKLKQFKKDIANDKYLKEISRNIDNPLQLISQKKFRPYFSSYSNELKKELKINKIITDEVLEYILFKISKFLRQKTKVDKNDVMDLLILYSLYLKGYLLLTLDNKLIEALRTVDKDSYDFIVSLGIK